MNRDDLTKAIVTLHKEQASPASIENVFNVIKQLVNSNEKVYLAIDWTPDEKLIYECVHLTVQDKYYFIMYSDRKFFQEKFSKEIGQINITDFFDAYYEMYNLNFCSGIIINPATDTEMILEAKYIDQILGK